jgi:hypothetical protein
VRLFAWLALAAWIALTLGFTASSRTAGGVLALGSLGVLLMWCGRSRARARRRGRI